jgi:toxin ParE1/3/4
MNPLASFSLAALRDLEDKVAFIRKNSPISSLRFFHAVQKTAQLLLQFPKLGSLYDEQNPEFADVRWFNVSRFKKFLIFYKETDDGIEVFRLLHSAQDIPRILGLR